MGTIRAMHATGVKPAHVADSLGLLNRQFIGCSDEG